MKHLWEICHPYYCEEGNYFRDHSSSTQTIWKFKSWSDFLCEMSNADKDYNLLFRWDWKEEDGSGNPNYTDDDHYRNGHLKLFFMHQRKGYHSTSIVEVCRADEPAVIEYLRGYWEHMQTLWEPFAQSQQSGGKDV